MPARFALPLILAPLILMGLAAFAAYLLLQSCAVQIPMLAHLSRCTTDAERNARTQLQLASLQGEELQRRVFELERELSQMQCVGALPDPNAPLTRQGWDDQSLDMLYGCWLLDDTYRTRDVDTGDIRTYAGWQMCFDAKGNGRQSMKSDDGIDCDGPVTAQYAGTSLQIVEPENLTCSDGGYIHQRDITCRLGANGGASCDTVQPETKGEAKDVRFERAPT